MWSGFRIKNFLSQQHVSAFFTTGTYVKIQLFLSWMKIFFCILFVIKDDVISFHLYLRHSFSHPHPLLWLPSHLAGELPPSEKMRERLLSIALAATVPNSCDYGTSRRLNIITRYGTLIKKKNSVADPDPGTGAFQTPRSGMGKKNQDPYPG